MFSFVFHFQNLYFLTRLSYSLQNLSSRILYYERCCLWSLWLPSIVTTLLLCALALCLPSCVEGLALCLGFMPTSFVGGVSFVEFLYGDSRNPSWGEGGDVGLDTRTSKYILVFVFNYFSKLYSLYITYCYYCLSIHAWYCTYTCIFQESYWSTSTLILEESWGKVQEPFIGSSASLFGYLLW